MAEFVVLMTYEAQTSIRIKNAYEIIKDITMRDCFSYDDYRIFEFYKGDMIELIIYDTWHNANDPLLIRCVRLDGTEAIRAHAKDH